MSNFKRDFIQDFLADYPDKEVLKDFINKLPLSDFDKKYLVMKYCGEKVTPHKVMAYNLSLSQRYVSTLQDNIITRAIPYINMFFIKALDTSSQEQT
jgi:hypothetical protein